MTHITEIKDGDLLSSYGTDSRHFENSSTVPQPTSKSSTYLDGLPTMTKETLKASAVENGGYETPELNEKLYLHFKGYKKIEKLEEYTELGEGGIGDQSTSFSSFLFPSFPFSSFLFHCSCTPFLHS